MGRGRRRRWEGAMGVAGRRRFDRSAKYAAQWRRLRKSYGVGRGGSGAIAKIECEPGAD